MRSTLRVATVALVIGATLVGSPSDAEAQRRGSGSQEQSAPWPAISMGPRVGYDNNANGEVLGAQIRVPVLRNGRLELVPSADVTFVTRLRAYQGNLDAVYVTGGRRGGLYLGGGIAFRNSIFGAGTSAGARETKQGFSVVAGVKSGSTGSFASQIEIRWVFIKDVPFDPRSITFGVNFPLWGGGRRGGGSR